MFEPWLAVTGVGSLPHRSAQEGVADVLAFCPEFPYWPQFPRRSAGEEMYRQFSPGLPGIRWTGEPPAMEWRRDGDTEAELRRVYEAVVLLSGGEATEAGGGASWSLGAEETAWSLGPDDAAGFWAVTAALRETPPTTGGVKGQITGPLSLGLSVKDAGGRALLYEEDLMDGVARGLALKARWQERRLGLGYPGSPTRTVLLSLDEPYLGTFGSAYFPYRPETVLSYLEIFDETLSSWWGVHCCANTDWEFLLRTPVRFVSFDAYAFGERLVLYPEAVSAFLKAGRTLLWGIVPTSAELLALETAATLARRLSGLFETLAARGVETRRLARQAMVTPACGLAGLPVDGARRAMKLALEVSDIMRQDWGR